jgi:hypothetical protein
MSRRVYLLGVAVAMVAVAFAATEAALEPRASGVTRANARRLQPEMSRAEVERILGGLVEESEVDGAWSSRINAWQGTEGTAYVWIGHPHCPSGVTGAAGSCDGSPSPPGPTRQIRSPASAPSPAADR